MLTQDAGRTSLRDDQAVVRLHALPAQRSGESPLRMESDDAGLQSQTGLEPGELRETHGGGGSKSPAKRLKGAGRAFFSFTGCGIFPTRCRHQPELGEPKTGDPNFRTAGKSFFVHPAKPFTQPRDLLDGGFIASNPDTRACQSPNDARTDQRLVRDASRRTGR